MQESDVIKELITLLEKTHSFEQTLNGQTALIGDLGLESIQVIEYLCDVEDRFDLIIDEDKLADVQTFDDLAAVVVGLRSA